MKQYSYLVIFVDGREEHVKSTSSFEAAVLASALRIHSGKNTNIHSIRCPELGEVISGKRLTLTDK
jgi:hypothetical protein